MLYEAECPKCKKVHEYVSSMNLPVEDIRAAAPLCCGQRTIKLISVPQIGAMSFGSEKKVTMTDGTTLYSGSEYKAYMKKHNLVSESEGASQAAIVKKQKEKEWKKKLRKTVIDSYDKLAAGKTGY